MHCSSNCQQKRLLQEVKALLPNRSTTQDGFEPSISPFDRGALSSRLPDHHDLNPCFSGISTAIGYIVSIRVAQRMDKSNQN